MFFAFCVNFIATLIMHFFSRSSVYSPLSTPDMKAYNDNSARSNQSMKNIVSIPSKTPYKNLISYAEHIETSMNRDKRALSTQSIRNSDRKQRRDEILFLIFVQNVGDCLELVSTWLFRVKHCMILTSDVTIQSQCRGPCQYDVSDNFLYRQGVMHSRMGTKSNFDRHHFTAERLFRYLMPKVHDFMIANKILWIVRSDSDTWWNRTELKTYLGKYDDRSPVAFGNLYQKRPCCGPWKSQSLANQENSYLAGGAGVIMNKMAVAKIVDSMNDWPRATNGVGVFSGEDLWFGDCLLKSGIKMQHVSAMHQVPPSFEYAPRTLSVHKAVSYENKHGYQYQSFYEQLHLKQRRKRLIDLIRFNQENANTAYTYEIKPGDHGIGSQVHLMASCFSDALHANFAFEITGKWIFAGNRDFSYFFVPITHNAKRKVKCKRYQTKIQVLPEFSQHAKPWYIGVLASFLMTPNARLRQLISDTRQRKLLRTNAQSSIQLPRHFIGLQIRHSSSWVFGRTNIPLQSFMQKIIDGNLPNVPIFVSTEDLEVIKSFTLYSNFTFYYTNIERTNKNQAREILAGKLDGEKDGVNALINLFIMRQSSWFVGGFRSNWGRLVYEHMMGTDNMPAKSIILDWDSNMKDYAPENAEMI